MSTIKVSNIQNASASSAAITLDANGQATLNGLNYPTAGPLSNRNLIINGAMQVAQRGTSSTASDYGTVDRFRSVVSSGTVTQTQESLTSDDPYDEGFRYFFRATNTTAGSNDASEFRGLHQYVEAQNLALSGWNYKSSTSYVTLSFWARSSVAGTYYGVLRSRDGTEQAYSFAYTLSADTWTKITHTVPGNSNITFDSDNGTGLQVRLPIDLGTDYTTSGHTTEAWAAWDDASRCPDITHDWAGTTSATFDLTGVQLEVGSVATPFEHRSFEHELNMCRRYYQTNFPYGDAIAANSTYVSSFTAGNVNGPRGHVDYYQPMRSTPSLTFWNNHRNIVGGDNNIVYNTGSFLSTTVSSTSINATGFQFIPAAGAAGTQYYFNWEASAEL